MKRRGIFVQRWKIGEALQRIDPVNRAIRRRYSIQRRLYNVKKPNRLWHIDSNHKLIHWRIVLHGFGQRGTGLFRHFTLICSTLWKIVAFLMHTMNVIY